MVITAPPLRQSADRPRYCNAVSSSCEDPMWNSSDRFQTICKLGSNICNQDNCLFCICIWLRGFTSNSFYIDKNGWGGSGMQILTRVNWAFFSPVSCADDRGSVLALHQGWAGQHVNVYAVLCWEAECLLYGNIMEIQDSKTDIQIIPGKCYRPTPDLPAPLQCIPGPSVPLPNCDCIHELQTIMCQPSLLCRPPITIICNII